MATTIPPFPANPGPIHYGGSLTRKGRLSQQAIANKSFAYIARLEKLVRLDLGFASSGVVIPDADIARMIGRSVRYVQVARRKVEYLRFRVAIQTGISMDTDQSAAQITAYRRAHFREMLPDAIRVIADELMRPAHTVQERKLKVELARDVIDREGSFPKISRTDSHVKIDHDYTGLDSVSADLLAVMGTPAQTIGPSEEVSIALDANRKFANSKTLTYKQQEDALSTLEGMQPSSDLVN